MTNLIRLCLGTAMLALLLAAAPNVAAQPAADATVWSGEYFNNTTLGGPPVVLRGDSAINFFWPEWTSPAPGMVNTSNYSVRWIREIYFGTTGNWTFTTVNDDGMRVWVDDRITMDAWYDQGPTTHTGTIYLTAGNHLVRVEYYNRTLGGTARLSYALQGSYPEWKGEYYDNQSLTGSSTLTRNDSSINFDWGTGSPAAGIPADHFSVRWTRSLYLGGGTWRFTVTSDDGVRLWVDGALLIDRWYNQPPTSYSADKALAAGTHSVRMEYYENTVGAVARLAYALVSSPGGSWHAQYYTNVSLSGSPAVVSDVAAVDYNWGTGSPAAGIPADYFSAKWDGQPNLGSTGNYSINATADDGVRVWVDGVLVVDGWYDHPPTTFSATRYLTAGVHNVHVEYYERTGGAMIRLQIAPGSVPPPASGDVVVDDRGPGWQAGGSASSWRNSSAGVGGHSFWTFNNSYTAPYYNWARWYPSLPRAGYYEVFAYIPGGLATTTNARYWVYHNGTYNLAAHSQGFYSNQWVSLGTYYFSAGGGQNVSLTDVTYECYLCRTIVFDAIKFSPR